MSSSREARSEAIVAISKNRNMPRMTREAVSEAFQLLGVETISYYRPSGSLPADILVGERAYKERMIRK